MRRLARDRGTSGAFARGVDRAMRAVVDDRDRGVPGVTLSPTSSLAIASDAVEDATRHDHDRGARRRRTTEDSLRRRR